MATTSTHTVLATEHSHQMSAAAACSKASPHFRAVPVEREPVGPYAPSTPAPVTASQFADHRMLPPREAEAYTDDKSAAAAHVGPVPQQNTASRAGNSHPNAHSAPTTTLSSGRDGSCLLSIAKVLDGEGTVASDPPLVDSAAKEDASWLPSSFVLYDCGGTDAAAAQPAKVKVARRAGKKDLKPDRTPVTGESLPGLGSAPVMLSDSAQMPGLHPGSMPMLPRYSHAPAPGLATSADRFAAQLPTRVEAGSDSACFHCPHCTMAISAADIARSAAEQNMRLHASIAAQEPLASCMRVLQPEMVVGHPVATNPMLPPYTDLQQQFATQTMPVAQPMAGPGPVHNFSTAHTDVLPGVVMQPVMPDPTLPTALTAPDVAKEGKKVSKPRPRHIIHVGSELKDAVTRLTAMLPTSGPVAEIVQPLLDNSYKAFDTVYSARVTNEDFVRAMNETIHRLAKTHDGRARLKVVVKALKAHPDLQKPKRPARNVYAGDAMRYTTAGEPIPNKFRNKRPDKNTGSTPVLGRDSEEPQLAFRREYGSRLAFMELAQIVLGDTADTDSPHATATVQDKNLILWTGIVFLLDAALLQCSLAGAETSRCEVVKYFSDWVLPGRLHYIIKLLPHHEFSSRG